MRERILRALAAYETGDIDGALDALGPRMEETEAETMTQAQAEAGWPVVAAVYDWIALAQDRLRRERGEDVVAVMPVKTALHTALALLEGR